jgi:hypothetical protein
MAFYSITITLMIDTLRLQEETVEQVWFADDDTGSGGLHSLLDWLNIHPY